MSGLSAEERQALAKVMNERRNECRRIFMYDPQIPAYMDVIDPIIDQIARDRVRAALEAVARSIEAGVLPSHPNGGYRDGFARCAAIVRAAADTT